MDAVCVEAFVDSLGERHEVRELCVRDTDVCRRESFALIETPDTQLMNGEDAVDLAKTSMIDSSFSRRVFCRGVNVTDLHDIVLNILSFDAWRCAFQQDDGASLHCFTMSVLASPVSVCRVADRRTNGD